MNEEETRAEYVDPKLKEAGWGVVEGSKVLREYYFTDGRILTGGERAKPLKADYILVYKNQKLAVVEAKPLDANKTEGLGQAKQYAGKLQIEYTYSTNGKEIYQVNMKTGEEGDVDNFPTPEELWNKVNSDYNSWREKFDSIPYEDLGGTKKARYYQEIAVNNIPEGL